jgi:hypothetical protein
MGEGRLRGDEPLPESTLRLIREARDAQEEVWRTRDQFLSLLKTLGDLDAREQERDTASARRLANAVITLSERGENMDVDTVRLARAYLDAIEKARDAHSIALAEYAASHPEHLETLNRELSLEEMQQELNRIQAELQGEEDASEPEPGETPEE